MNRIEQTLAALQEKKEKAFITYITAGLPDYTKTKELIKAQEQAQTSKKHLHACRKCVEKVWKSRLYL